MTTIPNQQKHPLTFVDTSTFPLRVSWRIQSQTPLREHLLRSMNIVHPPALEFVSRRGNTIFKQELFQKSQVNNLTDS